MKYTIVLLLLTFCCSSCITEHDENLVTLAGRVVLLDSTGKSLNDYSGVTVSVDSTKFHAITDSTGAWKIDSLPAGEYNITATLAGAGTYHWYEQTYARGRYDLATINLAHVPELVPVVDSCYCTPNYLFGGTVLATGPNFARDPNTGLGEVMVIAGYCDRRPNVAPGERHISTSLPSWLNNTYTCTFDKSDLLGAGVKSGDTLYFSASLVASWFYIAESWNGQTSFYDPIAHDTRYASTGPKSNVVSLVVP